MVINQKPLTTTTKMAKNFNILRRSYYGTAPPPDNTMHPHHGSWRAPLRTPPQLLPHSHTITPPSSPAKLICLPLVGHDSGRHCFFLADCLLPGTASPSTKTHPSLLMASIYPFPHDPTRMAALCCARAPR
jgi:hypothetical protein